MRTFSIITSTGTEIQIDADVMNVEAKRTTLHRNGTGVVAVAPYPAIVFEVDNESEE